MPLLHQRLQKRSDHVNHRSSASTPGQQYYSVLGRKAKEKHIFVFGTRRRVSSCPNSVVHWSHANEPLSRVGYSGLRFPRVVGPWSMDGVVVLDKSLGLRFLFAGCLVLTVDEAKKKEEEEEERSRSRTRSEEAVFISRILTVVPLCIALKEQI